MARGSGKGEGETAVGAGAVAAEGGGGAEALAAQHRFPAGYRRMFLAAAEAFGERGFHATTTRDIASRAGMSPAALYIHFSSKEEVLYQIAVSGHELAFDVITSAAACCGRPAGRLAAVVRKFTAWHAHNHATARVVQYQLDALTPAHRAHVRAIQRKIDHAVRQIIEDGADRGDFDVADVPGAATAILSLCVDVVRWYRPGYRRTPDEIAELYAEIALRVVGARG